LDNKLTQKLYSLDWESIIPELNRYAVLRLKHLGLYPEFSCDDVVNESIMRVLNGDRKWDDNKYPDIIIFMKMVIKSISSHLLESKITADNKHQEIRDSNPKPNEEIEQHYKDALTEIEELLADDDDLLLLYYAMADGHLKDKELSKVLDVEINEIRNMKKKD